MGSQGNPRGNQTAEAEKQKNKKAAVKIIRGQKKIKAGRSGKTVRRAVDRAKKRVQRK
jgi:hypothetical protein